MRQDTADTIRLVYRYARLKKFYDELADRTRIVYERFPWWPCAKGCSQCCLPSLFLVSEIEAQYLLPEVDKLGKYKKREVQAKARSIVSQVHQRLGYISWPEIVRTIGTTEEYPCPLLEDNACLIYDKRPGICRVFGLYLLNKEGQAYWCQRVEDAVTEHRQTEQVQAMMFDWVAERMKEVLVGDEVKPIAAWLADC